MQLFQNCPSCGCAHFLNILSVRDHSISGETFQIASCSACGLKLTIDAPAEHAISPYYQSTAYISHTDGNATFFEKTYQWVRTLALRSKRKLIQQYTRLPKGALLDMGCGTGAFLSTMKKAGWTVHGMEPDPGARTKAARAAQQEVLDPSGLQALPDHTMDVITLWHVLEHVHDLDHMLQTIKRLLTKNGVVFIAVPNADSSDARWYGSNWAAYDVPRHLYHFTPSTLSDLLNRNGLRVERMLPMHFDPFYVCLLSEKYRLGSMRPMRSIILATASFLIALFHKQRSSSLIYVVRTFMPGN